MNVPEDLVRDIPRADFNEGFADTEFGNHHAEVTEVGAFYKGG